MQWSKAWLGLGIFITVIVWALVGYTLFFHHDAKKTLAAVEIPIATTTLPVYEPQTLTWSLATSAAQWETRDSATSFVFAGKMWTMGGLDGNNKIDGNHVVHYWESPHFNDIWNSTDGVTWTRVAEHAAWPMRRSMSVVFFKDKLWMFGGFSPVSGYSNDVWQSTDGIHWAKVLEHAPWPPREGQTADVFDGKIWMMGGVNYDARKTRNDVWFTEDGLHWSQASTTSLWSPRWDHALAVFQHKLIVAGGMDLEHHTFNDVWESADGHTWQLATSSAPWATRQGHALMVFHDVLWVVGRLNDADGSGANDIWYSPDAHTWRKTDIDPPWIGREDHSVLLFKDSLWVFGGMDAKWNWEHDVWYSSL